MFTIIHLFVGLILGVMLKELGYLHSIEEIIFFVMGNVLIDTDHIISMFIIKDEPFITSKRLLLKRKLKELAYYMSKHHKEYNKLIFHNYLTFLVVLLVYLFFVYDPFLEAFLIGWLTHSVMDHFDDIYVVGHLRNWFWFLNNSGRNYQYILFVSIFVIIVAYFKFLYF